MYVDIHIIYINTISNTVPSGMKYVVDVLNKECTKETEVRERENNDLFRRISCRNYNNYECLEVTEG